ncbi:hypothetical protein PENTCL1PPCAC_21075, partial [Pristionchus entomophagus]
DYTDYTVLLAAQSGFIVVALLVFFFSLHVMGSFAAIHGNCKFFLLFTAVGQFSVILSHILKVRFWFTIEDYDRYWMYKQPFFKAVQPLNEFGFFLTDLNNSLMILERLYACWNLKSRYEESGTHWFYLIPSEAVCLALSTGLSYLMHFQQKVLECIIFAFVFEVFALFLLVLCYAHSTKAYGNLKDVNIQYQMREVEHITRALLPACLTSVLLRAAITVMALLVSVLLWTFEYSSFYYSIHIQIQTVNSAQYGPV